MPLLSPFDVIASALSDVDVEGVSCCNTGVCGRFGVALCSVILGLSVLDLSPFAKTSISKGSAFSDA